MFANIHLLISHRYSQHYLGLYTNMYSRLELPKNHNKRQLKEREEQFNNEEMATTLVSVKSRGATIYTKRISDQKLMSVRLCQKLIKSDKTIDLEVTMYQKQDHVIDASTQVDKKSYITSLFDKLLLYATTGYIEADEQYLMDLLYLSILLDLQYLRKQILTRKVNPTYYKKLWSVLLLVYNKNMTKMYDNMGTLMENNPRFLVNDKNQTQLSQGLLKFNTIHQMKAFLKTLASVLIKKSELTPKYFNLLQILLKYYIAMNKLNRSEYSPQVIASLVDPGNISQQVRKQLDKLKPNLQHSQSLETLFAKAKRLEQEKKGIQQKQKIQNEKLQKQLRKYEEDINRNKLQIQQLRKKDIELQVGFHTQKVVHLKQFEFCQQSTGIIMKPCLHVNCIDCSISRLANQLNAKQPIENYDIKCFSCTCKWTTPLFNLLKKKLNLTQI